jgi:hypothetical protein
MGSIEALWCEFCICDNLKAIELVFKFCFASLIFAGEIPPFTQLKFAQSEPLADSIRFAAAQQ